MEVSYAISKLARQQETFDIIYADLPHERGFEPKILEWLGDAKIMNPDTILILETSLDTPVDYVDTEQFEIVRIKEYKTISMCSFVPNKRAGRTRKGEEYESIQN